MDNKNKTKLCYIPVHIGLTGNIYADFADKYGCSGPLKEDSIIEYIDLKNFYSN